ncbi:MAG: nitrophenyl compound nitroreductase subunit ArsF family protein [Lepagella sp.]
MKHLFLILALSLTLGFAACSSGNNARSADSDSSAAVETPADGGNYVEVIYFHGLKRCPTCLAIEAETRQLVDSIFADDLKAGSLRFTIVDISTPEGEAIADRYEVSWSSLFINQWRNGSEQRHDYTDFAFENARNNPTEYKDSIAKDIRILLAE